MDQKEWEEAIIKYMTDGGWVNDRNDETTLGFKFIENEKEWIRDYDKRNRRFVQFDGNVRINLKMTQKAHKQNPWHPEQHHQSPGLPSD